MYPTRLGTFQHRGRVDGAPGLARTFPALLREAGYYAFNGSRGATAKLDYNFKPLDVPWDKVGSTEIEWRQRRPGQPFFGQLNLACTHQSQYGRDPYDLGPRAIPAAARVHDPARLRVPAYHPDTPAVREIWREYHDRVTQMDAEFGAVLALLEADGLADDTIVFFFGDNGHGIPGGKIWLYDEGLHVPLIVRIPAKWAALAGPLDARGVTDRLVSFIDFAPTMLSLAGVAIPPAMQGVPFLGAREGPPRERAFAARDFHDGADFDFSRAVREGDFLYLRNFLPHLGWDAIQYSWEQAPHLLEEWRQRAESGKLQADTRQAMFFRRSKPVEELYDLKLDPAQLRNLAGQPEHQAILARLRRECETWMRANHDLGLLSQYELYTRSESDSPGAMAVDPARNPTAELLAAATLAGSRDPAALPRLRELLRHRDSAIRRWGAIGLHALGAHAPARDALERALADASPDVRMTAAEALFGLGASERALPVLVALLQHPSRIIRNETLLALTRIGPPAKACCPTWRRRPGRRHSTTGSGRMTTSRGPWRWRAPASRETPTVLPGGRGYVISREHVPPICTHACSQLHDPAPPRDRCLPVARRGSDVAPRRSARSRGCLAVPARPGGSGRRRALVCGTLADTIRLPGALQEHGHEFKPGPDTMWWYGLKRPATLAPGFLFRERYNQPDNYRITAFLLTDRNS